MNNAFMEEKPDKLLTINNVKTTKGEKRGYLTGILYLYPFKAFGFNICANAEAAGCHEPCLHTAGRGQMSMVQMSRLRKTWLFHYEREWFMRQLIRDIEALIRKAQREGKIPVVRLNGTSDIDWENIRIDGRTLMEIFGNIQFYDYTKLPRIAKNRNYHLTFSYSGRAEYSKTVAKAQRLGMNMAVVSRDPVPEDKLTTVNGVPYTIVDGDRDDLRFLDPKGSVVWLKAKGKAKKCDTDFIVRVAA